MRAALSLAGRGLGQVWPNPAVGCILVAGHSQDMILGRGWTQPGGRPHAETEALARAGDAARGATAYVSLEPCAHQGRTPPCAMALVKAGVARVVTAIEDPDVRVRGGGLRQLRDAGAVVECGLLREEAEALNAGYLMRVRAGRPLVTLKLATTLDGRIATHGGESRWITGEAARRRAHLLRARNDAIMVGIGTALADDPDLTCRLPGLEERTPVRIVVDARLHLSLTSRLVITASRTPTWLVTVPGGDRGRRQAFEDCGVRIVEVAEGPDGYPAPAEMLVALGKAGLTRILVEGGGHLAAGLLRADLVDRLQWFRAAGIIGGDGVPAVAAYGIDRLSLMRRYRRRSVRWIGEDLLESYARHE
ncbi:MAG: bifunctional diaminohydroxyphosphoribosylaminopyrimidine deaminase/5-amino-6-(5-phosphoribosylamino)uracil reductase RibD [Rhodospirillales bacterium]|nr:MAG: bifunctional diaminohydroxyphosphoribosylaminopyrimidine deaminase/5-amino-6-(5-phosphoribosylamino)uracil reductase RibD [Rhodospirillales bacterium]